MTKLVKFYMVVAAAATMLTACDASAPDQVLVPNASEQVRDEHRVVPTRETKPSNKAEGVIGAEGGSLAVGGHTLRVPAGAVLEPTLFQMQVVEAQAIHVKLRAWRVSDGAAVTQFTSVPVEFVASVADVAEVDLSSLVIVYLRDGTYDGSKEVVRSALSRETSTLTGYLSHFSDYAVAREIVLGID